VRPRRRLRPPEVSSLVRELTARKLAERIERHATVLDDVDTPAVTRDRDDDWLVALARAADATAIVSGDRDLSEAGASDLPVWTPRNCAVRLGRDG
jgi:predicted nucleic acid-binding protein